MKITIKIEVEKFSAGEKPTENQESDENKAIYALRSLANEIEEVGFWAWTQPLYGSAETQPIGVCEIVDGFQA